MHPVMKIVNKVCDIGNNTIFQPATEICRGMSTVFMHSFRKPITGEYPEQRPLLSTRFKGRLALLINDDGSDTCTGCKMCARVCPCGDLIQIQTKKVETPEGKTKLQVEKYTIDLGRCIYCGNCTEACRQSCLVFIQDFEIADYSREALVFDKKMLSLSAEESQICRKQQMENK